MRSVEVTSYIIFGENLPLLKCCESDQVLIFSQESMRGLSGSLAFVLLRCLELIFEYRPRTNEYPTYQRVNKRSPPPMETHSSSNYKCVAGFLDGNTISDRGRIGRWKWSGVMKRHRFDGPGCGSASDRVSELNTSGRTEKEGVNVGGSSSKSFSFINSESSITLLQVSPEQWKHTAEHFIPAFRHPHIAPQFPLHLQRSILEAQGCWRRRSGRLERQPGKFPARDAKEFILDTIESSRTEFALTRAVPWILEFQKIRNSERVLL
ncbi:hypothetical protein EVAR_27283_1 [Eumeta japonica]|uniref:Uncharacterized protein n=1 Tax=Eumeta variegata TaxID=151549 RepID=A0A4C1UD56_EUMVA|nr:hypothetical protein EVAR_27283_1 [Eumeta japonica]